MGLCLDFTNQKTKTLKMDPSRSHKVKLMNQDPGRWSDSARKKSCGPQVPWERGPSLLGVGCSKKALLPTWCVALSKFLSPWISVFSSETWGWYPFERAAGRTKSSNMVTYPQEDDTQKIQDGTFSGKEGGRRKDSGREQRGLLF